MINKNYIVRFIDESNKQMLHYKELYLHSNDIHSRKLYRELYLKAIDIYQARYHMLLLFGYDVIFDENGNITGVKEI